MKVFAKISIQWKNVRIWKIVAIVTMAILGWRKTASRLAALNVLKPQPQLQLRQRQLLRPRLRPRLRPQLPQLVSLQNAYYKIVFCISWFDTFVYISATAGCPKPYWKGDTWCDDVNNIASCDWDGGDCCGENVKIHENYCTVCACLDPGYTTTTTTTTTTSKFFRLFHPGLSSLLDYLLKYRFSFSHQV